MSRTSPVRFPLAPVALATVVAVGLWSVPMTQAHAQTPGATVEVMHSIRLPAQPLGAALNELARQARVQLMVRPELVAGKQAAAVNGQMTVRQALERLLLGTGLEAVNEGNTVVVRARPAAADAASPATLPAVTVTAGSASAPDQTRSRGLMAVKPSTGLTRLDVAVRDQAQVVQIVPRESLEDRNVLSLHEAIETVAGVRVVSPAYASRTAGIRSRGFESADTYLNGVRFSGFGVPVESANIESVEVLKGPAGVQFGLAEPGGALNIVTKRPVATRMASARVTLGSHDTRRVDVDAGGALDQDARVLSRLNVSAEDNEAHRRFDRSKRVSVAPALTWHVSERTTVDLELGYLKNDYRFNRGLTPQPYILDLPRNFSTGEPNQPLSDNESVNFFYTLAHQFGDSGWGVRQRLAALRTRSNSFEVNSGIAAPDEDGNLSRSFYASYQKEDSWVLQHEVFGAFTAGGMAHRAVFGFEVGDIGREYGFQQTADAARNPPPLNVLNPVYGGYVFPTASELVDSYPPETYGNRYRALYADWHATLTPQWRAMAGVRLDRTRGYYRAADGSVSYGAADSRAVTPRLGVVWRPEPRTDVFANYATGFSPNLFADSAGRLFDTPEKSRQLEVGARYELIPERLRVTASAFAIVKKNVQTPDPSDPSGNRSVLAGEQRSDGYELELAGAITPSWDITLGYAHTDARTTEHSDPAERGVPLVDAPRHHVTLWTKYRLTAISPGLWVGYGLAYASERRSSSANAAFQLPSYTRHDLAAGLVDGSWTYQVNLGNVTNERVYYTHGNNIHLQPGRNVRASVAYRF